MGVYTRIDEKYHKLPHSQGVLWGDSGRRIFLRIYVCIYTKGNKAMKSISNFVELVSKMNGSKITARMSLWTNVQK